MRRTKKFFILIGPPLIPIPLFLLGSGFLEDLYSEDLVSISVISRRISIFAGGSSDADLLHNLLLLDQERTYNAVLDTVGAARTTVGTLNGLLGLGDLRVLAGTESRNLVASVLLVIVVSISP